MARPLRLEYPGSLWHVTARGNEKRSIVEDDADRRCFIRLLGECVIRYGWVLYSYALMSNHFHLELELTRPTLSRGMQWLNAKYAQRYNRRHDRVGHLFQGRFAAFLIEKESYFVEVLRYVLLNPVRAGMVRSPADYPWTSFLSTVGDAPSPEWLAVDRVLKSFGDDRLAARARYRNFVLEGIGAAGPWADLVGQIYLGSEEWIEKVREKVEEKPRSDEYPRGQRDFGMITMVDVIAAVSESMNTDADTIRRGRGGEGRMLCAWIAAHEGQVRLREIAAALHLRSASHVSALVRGCENALDRDLSLRAHADRSWELISRQAVPGKGENRQPQL